jgi:tRNA (cytidine32/guanosine34-2'-O)-methyltransferase
MGKISKDKRDIYYRLAKQLNYRSRSAFKLLQIDDTFKIFSNVKTIVDLCAAPGGWSQVCNEKLKDIKDKKIISVDLQKFAPIENVDIIIGDITNKDIILDIISKTNNQLIDLVICDGAPDITGFNEFDVYIQSQLVLNALNTSIRILKIGGNFITKLFKGKYTDKIIQIFLTCFNKVIITKPKACRNASFESFIFCQGFKEDNNIIQQLRKKELSEDDIIILNKLKIVNDNEEFNYEKFNVDFIQVGNDEYDSDKTYDLESTNYQKILNPVQMPINPPYKYYVENLKGKNVKE